MSIATTERVQEPREKSLCWRFLNWLSVVEEKEPNQERNTRTYLKEAMEEHLISSSESFRIPTLANCAIQCISCRHSGCCGVWHMLLLSFKSSYVSMLFRRSF